MSGGLVVLVVVALGFVALGLQVLSRRIQRYPMDVRRADPLIDVSRTKTLNVRPAELHQLIGVVSNSMISEASQRNELQPILDSLGASAPPRRGGKSRIRARAKGKRAQGIEQAISDLEELWLPERISDDP